MKNFVKKCCCIFASTLLSTNLMVSNVAAKIIDASIEVHQITDTTLSPSSTLQCTIKDPYHVLTQEKRNFLEQVFYSTFEDIWNKYGYPSKSPPPVTFVIDDNFVPTDFIGSEYGDGFIAFKKSVFLNTDENTKDSIIHELTHIAQDYRNVKTFSWITEGIADCLTAKYSPHKSLAIPTQYTGGELYDGYLTTAGFLTWLDRQYPNSIMKLHRMMQQGIIEYQSFQEMTGKTLSDLWKEYSGKPLPSIEDYYLSQSQSNTANFIKLGDYYFYGYASKPDYEKALTYYQKAADNNDFYALTRVADIYSTYSAEPDFHKAYTLYKKVADSKTFYSAYACNTLGRLIQNNMIKNIDPSNAAFYFKQAIVIEENMSLISVQSAYAMEQLGDICYRANDPDAVNWYRKAVDYGSDYARMILECYIPSNKEQRSVVAW